MQVKIILLPFILFVSCMASTNDNTATIDIQIKVEDSIQVVYDSVIQTSYDFLFDSMLCNGFDFPVGSADGKGEYTDKKTGTKYTGWYKAVKFGEEYMYGVHPAEDWNGVGGGNTDLGQKVYAIGKGIVVEANDFGGNWGNVIVIEHDYYENGKIKKIQSLYAHLDTMYVKQGQIVSRRHNIGTIGNNYDMFPAHLHLEIRKETMFEYDVTYWPDSDIKWIERNYEFPTQFIKKHRSIQLPLQDSLIVIAVKHEYKSYLINYGKVTKEFPIALGQNPYGHKEVQGDNRTPEGEYYINQKSLGPFSGDWAEYFGTAWIRISYPNTYDAEEAYKNGLITVNQKNSITKAISQKGMPPKNTAIGGGIGIHGWAGEWNPQDQNNLTWGCISINNDQLLEFYQLVPLNTRIIVLP